MRRFFCDNITADIATITGDDAHHISRVLRMKAGDALSLCDGAGNEYDALITSVSPEAVVCALGEQHDGRGGKPRSRSRCFNACPRRARWN